MELTGNAYCAVVCFQGASEVMSIAPGEKQTVFNAKPGANRLAFKVRCTSDSDSSIGKYMTIISACFAPAVIESLAHASHAKVIVHGKALGIDIR